MPGQSNIEWTDATWNPVTGCSKVSAGCKNCYAEAYFARPYPGRKFTDVRIHPERLDWPLRWRGSPKAKGEGRPSRIFVNSMSDLFHDAIEPGFIDKCFAAMALSQGKVFQVLTKRPERMLHYFTGIKDVPGLQGICAESRIARVAATWALLRGEDTTSAYWDAFLEQPYSNVWLGVSVEDQKTADERIPILLQTPAAVRWVSYEPALRPVDLKAYLPIDSLNHLQIEKSENQSMRKSVNSLDWIVAGGESGPHARPPHPDWFRKVRDDCVAAGVPFFFKQWGAWASVPKSDDLQDSDAMMLPDGEFEPLRQHFSQAFKSQRMRFVGKKKAGRLLDGREWNEFPKMQ